MPLLPPYRLDQAELLIGLWLYGSGSGRAQAWILKICRVSIGPDAVAKSRYSLSDRVFAIAEIKQRKHLV